MSDDDRLAELFRTAASDVGVPPPGFDHDDVVTASRRITARRRSALLGGAFALFAVVGVGAAVAVPDTPATTSAAAPAPGDLAGAERAAVAPEGAPVPDAARSGGAAESGGAAASGGAAGSSGAADSAAPQLAQPAPPFTGTPLGPGNAPCADRQDPQLRAYLEQVLPEVIGAPTAASTEECRPGTQRYLTLEVQDGPAHGLLGVAYLPPGPTPEPPPGSVAARTASGGTVVVSTGPMGGTVPPPFLNRLGEVAAYLAPRL
ncbi:MAG TPA: hypothetical protein VNA11_07040 [Pseudonocardia sp.]|nr:hypothetical protein [Pseudonocardia sp.]